MKKKIAKEASYRAPLLGRTQRFDVSDPAPYMGTKIADADPTAEGPHILLPVTSYGLLAHRSPSPELVCPMCSLGWSSNMQYPRRQ